MPVVTIDGRKIETQPGKTIIEAANDNGIHIPHFCWHPSLSVAGNCRMCLVNVGSHKKNAEGQVELDAEGNPQVAWMPKLQIACSTPVSDGMIVSTGDDKSVKASNAVMEFLLVNHPLDCPICDEAGQCKLQEYAYKYSKGESRFIDVKNHKDKREAWGPNVMFDAERCISCSRCIRYAKEIAKQPVLTFVQRGDHVTIKLFEGTQFDSPYSMNVIELCPVGALTSMDFRFKARVWDMSFNESVCPGCARGCNIQIGVKDNTILRLEPRANPFVNQYWMCDAGRLQNYHWVNENRVGSVHLRRNGQLSASDWKTGFAEIAKNLSSHSASKVLIVVGGWCTNEDAFAAKKLASDVLKGAHIVYVQRNNNDFADDFLRVADRNANSNGFEAIGIKSVAESEVAALVKHADCALVLGDELIRGNSEVRAAIESLKFFAQVTMNMCESVELAHVVLGCSTYAESEGTFTNIDKRVQHFSPALVTAENQRSMGLKMSRLDRFGAHNDRWNQGAKRDVIQCWRIVQGIAEALGSSWGFGSSQHVFKQLAETVSGFSLMSYEQLDARHGIVLGKASEPQEDVVLYESHFMKPN